MKSKAASSHHALVLTPSSGRKLGAAETRFNKLLAELQTLRTRIATRSASLDAALKVYAEVLAPEEVSEDKARRDLILTLGALWQSGECIKKPQLPLIRDLLLEQIHFLRTDVSEEPEGSMATLLKALLSDANKSQRIPSETDKSLEDFARDLMNSPHFTDPEVISAMDHSRFDNSMTQEEVLEEFKRQAEDIVKRRERAQTEAKAAAPTAKATKAQLREAAMAEAREKTLSSIFKQLVKVLHPDLERDPARQAEKHALMQRVNAAYKAQDLFTLLQLELEFLRGEEKPNSGLDDAKLHVYIEVLKDQVALLKEEYANVSAEPRYAMIYRYVEGTRSRNPRWKDLAEAARLRTLDMRRCQTALQKSPASARNEMKDIITAYKEGLAMRRYLLSEDLF